MVLFVFLLVLFLVSIAAWRVFFCDYFYRARILESKLCEQGIRGPPRSILRGNIHQMMQLRAESESRTLPTITHDIAEYVQPHLVHWFKTYGSPFLMWWAHEPRVVIQDVDLAKEILYNKSGIFWRSGMQQRFLSDVIGRGLVVVNGDEWAFRRHVMAPAFYHEKIKKMVGTMVSCISDMLTKWEEIVGDSKEAVEVEVSEPVTDLTAHIISRTAFGSSHEEGHKVFELVQTLGGLVLQRFSRPWTESFIPTSKLNTNIKRTQKQLDSLLEGVIQTRRDLKNNGKTENYGDDLLGLLLEEVDESRIDTHNGLEFTSKSLMEECKTFYVAGHETTAKLITWTLLLLASNPTWQDRARAEVLEICKSGLPDAEAAGKLKIVGMVLNESLRLYPPAVFMVRNAFEDTKLGDLEVLKGTGVLIPIICIHHDKEVWGEDANEFNPERFADGIASAAKHPFAFLPFSHGPRVCLGQAFSLMEAKLALAMILQKFVFEMSPSYRHSPVLRLTLMPKYGLPLLLKRL